MRIEGPVNAAEVMVQAPKKRILLSAYPTAWGPKRAPLRMTRLAVLFEKRTTRIR